MATLDDYLWSEIKARGDLLNKGNGFFVDGFGTDRLPSYTCDWGVLCIKSRTGDTGTAILD